MRQARLFFSVVAATLLASAIAHADASTSAAAEALYDEGKKLETKGDFSAACPKFAESQKLDPAAGTLLHLANCYEKTTRLASAWATYLDAASAARAQNRADWEKAARTKAAALEPRLPRLVIIVDAPTPGIEVKRDDIAVSSASFGVPIPVDAGKHAILAEAAGKKSFTTSVDVTGEGTKAEVHVPKLEDAPAPTPNASATTAPPPSASASAPPPPPSGGSSRKTIGYVVGGVGVVGLGVGGVTGLMAISANDDSKKKCPGNGPCTDKTGVDANDRAKTLGTVSTIGFIAGGVLLAGGLAIVLTAPSDKEKKSATSIQVAPQAGPSGAGLLVQGAF